MQIILTSYKRPQYLKQTLSKLQKVNDLDIYVVDGGGDVEIERILHFSFAKKEIIGFAILKDNPGADIARNVGILNFVTGKQFIISTDDLLPPERKDWLSDLCESFEKLNYEKMKFPLVSGIVSHYLNKFKRRNTEWLNINDVWCYGVTRSDTIGAIVDTETIKRVGLWPTEYGKAGYGTRALCMRLRNHGYKTIYLRDFIWKHIGSREEKDFPEQFNSDKQEAKEIVRFANKDLLRNKRKIIDYENLIQTIRGQKIE